MIQRIFKPLVPGLSRVIAAAGGVVSPASVAVFLGVIVLMGTVAAAAMRAPQAPAPPRIWSGVFTAAQAERGHEVYSAFCISCHGDRLDGGEGPALAGEGFFRNWVEYDLNQLVTKIRATMPGEAPGTLSAQEATDVTSYLLARNGFPAGAQELPSDADAQTAVRIVGKDGPGPVPNFALVLVVGCLVKGADAGWALTNGTDPVRARADGAEGTREAQTLAAQTGRGTFSLMDAHLFGPEKLQGQKVAVKGLLMRQADVTRVNVTSIQSLAPACQ